jgi:cell wall-associated NlpC family hydrolase
MISSDQLEIFKKHCINQYPKEACALVVSGEVIIVDNIHKDPINHFTITADRYAQYLIDGSLQAVLHSHTSTNKSPSYNRVDLRTPSEQDQISQIEMGVPWGILGTDGATCSDPIWIGCDEEPLEGRVFIHGKNDCLSLFLDYYKTVLGISIPNYPREYEWWLKGGDNYTEDRFTDNGFVEVSKQSIKIHDVLLIQFRSPVPQHAAIYTGNNQILHQLPNRLSGYDSLTKWSKYIVRVYRHKSLIT